MDSLRKRLRAEVTEAVLKELKGSIMTEVIDTMIKRLRAEVTEAVLKEFKGSIVTEVIDTMIKNQEQAISSLRYDVSPRTEPKHC